MKAHIRIFDVIVVMLGASAIPMVEWSKKLVSWKTKKVNGL